MQKKTLENNALSADNQTSALEDTYDNLSPFDISNPDDEFHALYWPMEKWMNDSSAADLINELTRKYPGLRWNNPLSAQFNAMLSIFQNVELVKHYIVYYDYTIIDFMRLMLSNWPELFTKKRYASALSTVIVSCLI